MIQGQIEFAFQILIQQNIFLGNETFDGRKNSLVFEAPRVDVTEELADIGGWNRHDQKVATVHDRLNAILHVEKRYIEIGRRKVMGVVPALFDMLNRRSIPYPPRKLKAIVRQNLHQGRSPAAISNNPYFERCWHVIRFGLI